jgi:hypothetical protein
LGCTPICRISAQMEEDLRMGRSLRAREILGLSILTYLS